MVDAPAHLAHINRGDLFRSDRHPMTDKETLAVYAERAAEYRSKFSPDKNTHLEAFIAKLDPGAHVLDLGCGPGTWSGMMAKAGLRVTAIDPVPEMVEIAAEAAGVTARVGGFDDVTQDAEFDAVWANFSLLHAERQDLPRYLAAIATSLVPGGLFHIGMKTGEGMARDPIGRRYTYVTQTELEGLLTKAGLTPTEHWTGEDLGLAGTVDPWVQIHATKHA